MSDPQKIVALHPQSMLTLKQVLGIVPLSHTQVYRQMKSGAFPSSVKIGGRRVAWHLADVLDWVQSRPG